MTDSPPIMTRTRRSTARQKACEPEVMGVGDCPIPEAVGFLERQPEAGTNRSRRPARDQCQKGQREKTARLLLGSGFIIRLEFHWGANVTERNHLQTGLTGASRASQAGPSRRGISWSRPNRGRNRNRLWHALFALRSPILSAPLPRRAQHLIRKLSIPRNSDLHPSHLWRSPAVSSPIGKEMAF